MRLVTIAQALSMFDIDQRTLATEISISQPTLSRMSGKSWTELEGATIVRVFEAIHRLRDEGRFTISYTSASTVGHVYLNSAQTEGVIVRPYRPNEC